MKNNMRIPSILTPLFLVIASCAWGEIVLVEKGGQPCPIFTPASSGSPDDFAAKELSAYLGKISGAQFPVQVAPSPLPERGIFVGVVDPTLAAGLESDSYRIVTDKQRLHIVGGGPRGTLYGIYDFLETSMGCRWWSRNEEDVPTGQATLKVGDLNLTRKAPFALHKVWNNEATSRDNHFADKARSDGLEDMIGSHTLTPLLNPYALQHPEIYPMNAKGERKFNKLHFCYIAPGIAEALVEALEKVVEQHKGNVKDVIYFAGMGDWYGGMCECPACKKIYEEELWVNPDGGKAPGYTATLLRMINKTAEILEKKYPGIRIGTFAYMSLEAPPAKTVPRSNVVIRVPRLRHCGVHGVGELCPKNKGFSRNLEQWCKLAPGRVYVWEYGASFRNFLEPFPCLYSMADNLRYYHKIGVKGVEIQGNYVSTGGDLAVLKNYVWSKIFWNPALDPKAVLDEFCKGYYGPAAGDILAYVNVVEDSVRSPKKLCADEFAKFPWLTPEVLTQLGKIREKALAAVADKEPYLQRVREATVGVEVVALWNRGPLEEQNGKLIRKDLGEYTYPRALDLVKGLRNSGATEWSAGPAAQAGFLTLHGGPLVTFTNGPVEVKIAPVLNGRIRQIFYAGKGILSVESGGSRVNAGTRAMQLAGIPSANEVCMEGGGLGLFSRAPKFMVELKMNMSADGILTTLGTVRGPATFAPSVSTVYAAEKDPATLRVEYSTTEGSWKAIPLPAGTNACVLPPLIGLRIGLPEQKCTVVDRYISSGVSEARITVDAKNRTLTTVVVLAETAAPAKADTVFVTRTIQVGPLQETGAVSPISPKVESMPAKPAKAPKAPPASSAPTKEELPEDHPDRMKEDAIANPAGGDPEIPK